ncbi:MAG: YdeI/OmpD-associated family protein [Bacteroidetes bacterium]|nr:YdeI/OmpD-associated family protein [Bacteroidota bacterium]
MHSFTTTLQNFSNNVYGLHLPLPEDIAQAILASGNKRVLCTINEIETIHSGIMAVKPYWYILINQQLAKRLNLSIGEQVQVQLKEDKSEFGMKMPEELEEVFAQDLVAKSHFLELTPGKQRNLIHIVAKVKNTQSRINKALAICHHLNEVNGQLDFKMLNSTIKKYNQLR